MRCICQVEHTEFPVEDKQADFVFTATDDQCTLKETLRALADGPPGVG
jgi:hypothetical protein